MSTAVYTNRRKKFIRVANKDGIIQSVWSGLINPHHLPREMYYNTANYLKGNLYKGFGSTLKTVEFGTPNAKLLNELRTNIYVFSAAKTFQQVEAMEKLKETSRALAETNNFKDFKEKAGHIYDDYNETYLRAEYITAEFSARNAAKWNDIQANKELFPLLRYSAVMDDHTCEICAPLDQTVLPVDDPFWNEFMPPNHFMCKCLTEQLDEDDAKVSEDTNELAESTRDKMDDVFLMNSGKDGVIFKDEGPDKHPYFDVEPKYQRLAENNFNLPIPDNDND